MKVIVYSDIHNRIRIADKCINKEKPDKTIFLGDFFDFWGDTPEDAKKVALWLKKGLKDSSRIFLMGNHDLSYFGYPRILGLNCSGWTKEKSEAVNSVLTIDDWKKFKFVYEEQGWYISHAGLHKGLFWDSKNKKLTFDSVEGLNQEIWNTLLAGEMHRYVGCGIDRGGRQQVGGLTWGCWSSFAPIDQIKQIIGHTIRESPKCKKTKNGNENWNLDTNNHHIGWIIDGVFSFEENKYLEPEKDFLKRYKTLRWD